MNKKIIMKKIIMKKILKIMMNKDLINLANQVKNITKNLKFNNLKKKVVFKIKVI